MLLAATLGCRDEAESPTGPAPALDVAAAAAPLSFRQVSVGGFPGGSDFHACGVTTDDRAYCWGLNTWGQLGIGSVYEGPEDCGNPCSTRPVAVVGGHRWKHVRAGDRFTCGVTTDNQAYCWGRNIEGQLGSPTDVPQGSPIPVAGSRKFRQIRVGVAHACAITPANVAFCWGANWNGSLGDGTTTSRPTPVRVLGTQSWRELTADYNHTCGTTFDNRAYCWGAGGKIGDGTTTQRLRPTGVAGGLAFRQVDAGWQHTCGVSTANLAYCWGSGALGDGTTGTHLAPVKVGGKRLFDNVSAGFSYTCGVTLGGRGFCWGANGVGQLGTGDTYPRSGGPVPLGVELPWTMIAAGGASTCGVTTADRAYCWGDNASGELGDGTTTSRLLPTPVVGPM
jgi:alpha-tubulin suppressor-like RCC1 family protein